MRRLIPTDIATNRLAIPHQASYLGSWCFSSIEEEKLARSAQLILDYHWDCRDKLDSDFHYLGELNNQILRELTPQLNLIHGTKRSDKFWRILLGYWLNIYTCVLFDRWSSLRKASSLRSDWQMVELMARPHDYALNDTLTFVEAATESSLWNHYVFSLLAKYIPSIQLIPGQASYFTAKSQQTTNKNRSLLKVLGINVLRFFQHLFKRSDRFFMINTYLPFLHHLKLELLLRQVPIPFTGYSFSSEFNYNSNYRKWSLAVAPSADEFGRIVRELLPLFMPRVFLEGFNSLILESSKLPWPKSPEIIFTSNRHFFDDLFKVWAAQKASCGARIIIGEHGGLGVGLFNGTHRYELSIADIYLTTGWTNKNHNNIRPLGYFRSIIPSKRNRSTGKALLVCGNMPRFAFDVRSMALSSQTLDYFDDQFRFVSHLPSIIQSKLLVRLCPVDYGWQQKNRWLEHYPSIRFDDLMQPMKVSASQCRLFIATYNATTYIETLVSNLPTVIFWDPTRWEIKPEAFPYFQIMKNCGIFHSSPKSAALHVSMIWHDVDKWWFSDEVQQARTTFCNSYASSSLNLLGSLRDLFYEEIRTSSCKHSSSDL